MTNYCQYLARGLTLLKQFLTRACIYALGKNRGFYEGPYV